ncbi:MAG: thymidylate kinase [Patescibacteria group bacterium]|nr:thymidylate kinase [Patescibacteria group bacterium]
MPTKGKFFVIDGTDGSGKKTQTELMVEKLRASGRRVETVSFPRYGKQSCSAVSDYLSGRFGAAHEVDPKVASMFYAMDRYDASPQIRAWLDEGAIVIADRYVSSNMGHQCGKIGDPEGREACIRWNKELEYGLLNLPRPDLTVILHVPAEIYLRLLKERDGEHQDIHQADPEHLKNAEETYLEIAKSDAQYRLVECAPEGVLLSREAIHELVWQEVEKTLTQADG